MRKLAICPVCKQIFGVPSRLFYRLEVIDGFLKTLPDTRALFYHKYNDRYCISNGVKEQTQ